MFTLRLAAALLFSLWTAHAHASARQQPAGAAPQQPAPAPQQPGIVAPQTPAPGGAPLIPAPVVPPPLAARVFTTTTGMIFNAVRPERVADFETVIGYLQAALDKATDAEVRAQAKGWRIFKAAEPGPNGTVVYVFVFDPAAPGADYGLGRILSDAYPDRIQEIWKLYTGALTGGGSLLNLTAVVGPPPVASEKAREPAAPAPLPRPSPPAPGAAAPNQ